MSETETGKSDRPYVLERKDDGGYISLNRRYFPPKVEVWADPLDADRFSSTEDAIAAISDVHKERPERYRVRALKVEVI